ncbi:MAG: hypothetical protein IJU27_02485 [Bacteroidales bacterium]|nr:hypothetical protein [Bacteroidales bacterium]
MKSKIIILSLVALVLNACNSYDQEEKLDWVESHVYDMPENALDTLGAVNYSEIRGKKMKARYSLLMVIALDQCGRSIMRPELFSDAEVWYSKHGSPDERMKMNYYRSLVLKEQGFIRESAVALSEAERWAEKSSDSYSVVMLYLSLANEYNTASNSREVGKYMQKAIDALENAGLTTSFLERRRSKDDPMIMPLFLSNYAKSKLLRQDKDPRMAIGLLERKRDDYDSPFSAEEWAEYAYCRYLLGDIAGADAIVDSLAKEDQATIGPAYIWMASISQQQSKIGEAYEYILKSYAYNNTEVEAIINDSITAALQEHLRQKEYEMNRRERILLFLSVLFVFTFIALIVFFRYRKLRVERDVSRLKAIVDSLEGEVTRLHVYQNFARKKKGESHIEEERKRYLESCIRHIHDMGDMNYSLWKGKLQNSSDKRVLEEIVNTFDYVYDSDGNGEALIAWLDRELDGSVSKIINAIPLTNPAQARLLCFFILGLDTKMISDITEMSLNNIYTTKSRILKQINSLDSSIREEAMILLTGYK